MIPTDGTQLLQRWVEELTELGYRPGPDPQAARPVGVDPVALVSAVSADRAVVRPGAVDRDAAVETIMARLGARRSGWNAADVRGEVEQLIARTGLVAQAAVRLELAEDLTARALNACVPLLTHRGGTPWRGVPEHVRALTSPAVMEVEADITSRMITRAARPPVLAVLEPRLALGGVWPDHGLVFTNADGQPPHPDTMSGTFDRLVKSSGLPRITVHALRHTHATILLASGESV